MKVCQKMQGVVKRIILSLLPVVIMVITGRPAMAQSNVYGIDDAFYKRLIFATENLNNIRGLEAADSLYKLASKAADGKTMCLALTVPLRHYSARAQRDSVRAYADRIAEVARRTDNLQYYYYAETSRVIFDINQYQFHDAIEGVNRMWATAFDVDTTAYGRFSAMQALGHLFTGLSDRDLAIKQYKAALDFMQDNVTGQDQGGIAYRIARLYLEKGEIDSAEVYCKFALRNTRTQRIQMLSLMLRSRILFERGERDEFEKAYKHAFDRIYNKDMASDSDAIYFFMIDRAKADDDRRVALQYASRIKDKVLASETKAHVHEYFGETHKALDETKRTRFLLDSLRDEVVVEQMGILDHAVLQPKSQQDYADLLRRDDGASATSGDSLWVILFVVLAVLAGVGAVVVSIYVREKKKEAAAELAISRAKAEEEKLAAENAEKVRATTYVQTMGRNMLNPLNAVVGFSQLLSDTDSYLSDDLRKRYSDVVRANCNLLMALIDDMTDLAELEMQMHSITLAEVSPNAVVRDVIDMFEAKAPDASAAGITVELDTELPDDYTIMSDSTRLRQVLNQLLSNAEKFTNNFDGGTVHIGISLTENLGRLTISVADNGIGVPADKAEEVFEKFVKLNKAVPGNGIGLAVVKLIVKNLGGEVYLDTSYTRGARFVVLLPVGN